MNEGCSTQEDTAHPPSTPITKTEPQPPSIPPTPPSRPPLVPSSFYTTSLARNSKMDLPTLGQAFNASPKDLKHLLNTASIILAERNCLNTPSRSKATTAARPEAVLAAIHSIHFFAGFYERTIKRYDAFVNAMVASVARLCDEEFREWRRKRGDGEDIASDSAGREARAATNGLPTPPATPRKPTPLRSAAGKATAASTNRRRVKNLASPSKRAKKSVTGKGKR